MIGSHGTEAKYGKRRREGKRNKRRERVERGRSNKGRGTVSDIIRARWKKYFTLTFNKPSIAHTKESNALIDDYLDSICLISPKRHSITRELEILNYWCGISKEEPRKYANTGCPGGT